MSSLLLQLHGIILPILALGYLVLFETRTLKDNMVIFLGWVVIGSIWFYMRSTSIEPIIKPTLSEYAELFISRLPLFIQYTGKSILPFNLSVFPMQADTTIYLGLIAMILIVVLIFLHKTFNKKMVLFGFVWFTFFLLPAFFVPTEINEQAFEHRLYLPIVGLFIILSESVLFSESSIPNQKITFWSFIAVSILFIGINYGHQQKFKNEITFWENAAIDSPSSSYAHKMLGIKYFNKKLYDKSNEEIKRAFELDSTERYVNFYYAKNVEIKNPKDPKIEYYLLQEEKINSGFIDNLFELARVNFEKGDKKMAKYYLEESVRVAPTFISAKNNLLLLLIETGEKEEALDYINQWKKDKSGVPEGLEKEVNKM
jgi:Tfp pilus assembly protein PilF